ncbi:hypothetical protein AQUCO_03100098v1 [Aquilegia coerulea]|uniref:Uncharacterized protein n=1 Tax=Aquilegia coerulea TaxID=218851 RepID=A0A2G5D0R2_AQUCA|nr:hypothetical protein AQUCO_03100098v1 [Aquilegia coerulea]
MCCGLLVTNANLMVDLFGTLRVTNFLMITWIMYFCDQNPFQKGRMMPHLRFHASNDVLVFTSTNIPRLSN